MNWPSLPAPIRWPGRSLRRRPANLRWKPPRFTWRNSPRAPKEVRTEMIQDGKLLNYYGGTWKQSRATEFLPVGNPATGETLVQVPLTPRDEVDEAVQAAQVAFPDWRQ